MALKGHPVSFGPPAVSYALYRTFPVLGNQEYGQARRGRGAEAPHYQSLYEYRVVPKGTRINFQLYPALRLRLRAGLNSFAPTGLDFELGNSTGKYQLWLSHRLYPCGRRH